MKCEYCEKGRAEILYEDGEVVVAVKDTAFLPGQITIFPQEHFTIMEMVPDRILAKCAWLANQVSIAIFESLGAQGTNLLLQNGLSAGQKVPHFALEVIPRREGDGLKWQWEPKSLTEDEIETTFLMLKEEGEKLVNLGQKEERKKETKEKPVDKITEEEGKENYLLKALKRRP